MNLEDDGEKFGNTSRKDIVKGDGTVVARKYFVHVYDSILFVLSNTSDKTYTLLTKHFQKWSRVPEVLSAAQLFG